MYKTKLQELCHKKRWALPIYSCMRNGPDHNPQYKASVVVGGSNFDSDCISVSLREAHNEAAKLAFLHFSSDSEASQGGKRIEQALPSVGVNPNALIIEDGAEVHAKEQMTEKTDKSPEVHPISMDTENELQQKFKKKLQIYAEKKNLGLPVYRSVIEGTPNALCFRTIITVGGHSFESPQPYKTVKQAEGAAAHFALMSLSTAFSTAAFERMIAAGTRISYKNLLGAEGYFLPKYKTVRSGEAHNSTFFSTVEVEGEIFEGSPATSRKQAELNAAKVAYTAFMQRESRQTCDCLSSASEDELLKLASQSNSLTVADMKRDKTSESPVSTPTAKYEPQAEESKGKSCQTYDFSSGSSKDELLKLAPQVDSLTLADIKRNRISDSPVSAPTAKYEAQAEESKDEETVSTENRLSNLEVNIQDAISVVSDAGSSTMNMTTDKKSYLLCNRIRVYMYIPDVPSAKGNVVLPIAEGKWVVANLEFAKWKVI